MLPLNDRFAHGSRPELPGDTVTAIAQGSAPAQARQRIDHLASLVRRRGACAHPDGAVEFILGAVHTFGAELADHARFGSCQACAEAGELPLPHSAPQARRPDPQPPGRP